MTYDVYLDSAALTDAIYEDLSADERELFCWLTGYNGTARLSDDAIVQRLGISWGEYSHKKDQLNKHVESVKKGYKTDRKPFGFGYAQALKVTGGSRVAQRFLKFLLTPSGSDLSGNVRGTQLPSLVGGNIADLSHMQAVAHMAVQQAADQVKALSVPGFDGPGLVSATVSDVRSEANKVDIYVRLLTTDGEEARVQIPIPTDAARRANEANITRYATLLQGLEGP